MLIKIFMEKDALFKLAKAIRISSSSSVAKNIAIAPMTNGATQGMIESIKLLGKTQKSRFKNSRDTDI
ncbi:hypothetical protein GCM10027348_19260 [Hymenobacter tenuis]